jgi:hypothetical protein
MPDTVDWLVEHIPDHDDVFMRAHRDFFRGRRLQPGVFRPHGGGMSVDWEEYSSPEGTLQRAKDPQANAVICLLVAEIRDIKDLDVKHAPEPANRAHSNVVGFPEGEDLTEVRTKLLTASSVIIAL